MSGSLSGVLAVLGVSACVQQMWLTVGVNVVTPSRQRTSPLLLMAHRGTSSTLLWAVHGRMVTSLSAKGGISCQGPVVVSLHFLRKKTMCVRTPRSLHRGNRFMDSVYVYMCIVAAVILFYTKLYNVSKHWSLLRCGQPTSNVGVSDICCLLQINVFSYIWRTVFEGRDIPAAPQYFVMMFFCHTLYLNKKLPYYGEYYICFKIKS